jgi:hypothetical protein
MYATVRRYEGVSDPKEVARHVQEEFLPILSEMPGFVAYYWVDAGEGVVVTTSVFEHKEAEEETNWRAGDFVAEHIASLVPNPPQITDGEVVAHKKSTQTAQSAQPESRAEEERPAREEPERDEGILDKVKRKLQGQ